MATIRRARVVWQGDLASGSGRVTAATSGAFSDLPVTWASRTEAADGRTSPEELIAAAHAACYSMALSSELAKAGTPPTQLEVSATVTFDRVDGQWTVARSELQVTARVPGIAEEAFGAIAAAAKDGCPVSRALHGNVEITLAARLAG
jgi:osmotically inducible protein OsmC